MRLKWWSLLLLPSQQDPLGTRKMSKQKTKDEGVSPSSNSVPAARSGPARAACRRPGRRCGPDRGARAEKGGRDIRVAGEKAYSPAKGRDAVTSRATFPKGERAHSWRGGGDRLPAGGDQIRRPGKGDGNAGSCKEWKERQLGYSLCCWIRFRDAGVHSDFSINWHLKLNPRMHVVVALCVCTYSTVHCPPLFT